MIPAEYLPYNIYPGQRDEGALPPPSRFQPPDLRPSQVNPAYYPYPAAHGRSFSGVPTSDEGIANYPNELDRLAEGDDVVGNGVFDPHGTQGNIHPDYGVFADHQSLPGYIARDHFYQPSSVQDAWTNQPVLYVPGGAVQLDEAQLNAFNAMRMLEVPPGINPNDIQRVQKESIFIPDEGADPISGLGEVTTGSGTGTYLAWAAILGIGAGIFVATMSIKGK